MTKTLTPTFKEQILTMFNATTKECEVDELPIGQRSLYCAIHDLRTKDLFAQASQSRKHHDIDFENRLDYLTDEERNNLEKYREVFDWDERIFIESTWVAVERCDCEVEEGLEHALDIIKNPYQHERFLGGGLEFSDSYIQTLQPKVEIDNLRLKEEN